MNQKNAGDARRDPLSQRLAEEPFLLLDGGLATELERRGAALDDDLWSARLLLDDPELILDVHEAYVAASADVLITASYQANAGALRARGVDGEAARALLRRSVSLARIAGEGAARRPIVAASIGSYGASLGNGAEYVGRFGLSRRAYRAFHRPRLEALVEAGPDLFAIETLPSLDEAEALVEIVEEHGARAWLSFTCAEAGTTRGGDPLEQAAALAESSRSIVAVGVNCCAPDVVEGALFHLGAHTRKPLLAYPNSGEDWDPTARRWTKRSSLLPVSSYARRYVDAGARLVGGCCRTTPNDIAAMRHALAARPEERRAVS